MPRLVFNDMGAICASSAEETRRWMCLMMSMLTKMLHSAKSESKECDVLYLRARVGTVRNYKGRRVFCAGLCSNEWFHKIQALLKSFAGWSTTRPVATCHEHLFKIAGRPYRSRCRQTRTLGALDVTCEEWSEVNHFDSVLPLTIISHEQECSLAIRFSLQRRVVVPVSRLPSVIPAKHIDRMRIHHANSFVLRDLFEYRLSRYWSASNREATGRSMTLDGIVSLSLNVRQPLFTLFHTYTPERLALSTATKIVDAIFVDRVSTLLPHAMADGDDKPLQPPEKTVASEYSLYNELSYYPIKIHSSRV